MGGVAKPCPSEFQRSRENKSSFGANFLQLARQAAAMFNAVACRSVVHASGRSLAGSSLHFVCSLATELRDRGVPRPPLGFMHLQSIDERYLTRVALSRSNREEAGPAAAR